MRRWIPAAVAAAWLSAVPALAATVVVAPAAQQRLGVETAPLSIQQRSAEVDAFAKVLDPEPLVQLDSDLNSELLLFHEAPSRILISASDAEAVYEVARSAGVEAILIGATLKSRVVIRNGSQVLIDCRVDDLKETWSSSLERLLHNPVLV